LERAMVRLALNVRTVFHFSLSVLNVLIVM
jgi:hypothetical protein